MKLNLTRAEKFMLFIPSQTPIGICSEMADLPVETLAKAGMSLVTKIDALGINLTEAKAYVRAAYLMDACRATNAGRGPLEPKVLVAPAEAVTAKVAALLDPQDGEKVYLK